MKKQLVTPRCERQCGGPHQTQPATNSPLTNCRAMRELGAPSARRVANSFLACRPTAQQYVGDITQAMSNKNPTAACSASIAGLRPPFQNHHRDHRRADAMRSLSVLFASTGSRSLPLRSEPGHSYVGLEAGKRDKAITVLAAFVVRLWYTYRHPSWRSPLQNCRLKIRPASRRLP